MVNFTIGGNNEVGRRMIVADTMLDENSEGRVFNDGNFGYDGELQITSSASPGLRRRVLYKTRLEGLTDNSYELQNVFLYVNGIKTTADYNPIGVFKLKYNQWQEGLSGGLLPFNGDVSTAFVYTPKKRIIITNCDDDAFLGDWQSQIGTGGAGPQITFSNVDSPSNAVGNYCLKCIVDGATPRHESCYIPVNRWDTNEYIDWNNVGMIRFYARFYWNGSLQDLNFLKFFIEDNVGNRREWYFDILSATAGGTGWVTIELDNALGVEPGATPNYRNITKLGFDSLNGFSGANGWFFFDDIAIYRETLPLDEFEDLAPNNWDTTNCTYDRDNVIFYVGSYSAKITPNGLGEPYIEKDVGDFLLPTTYYGYSHIYLSARWNQGIPTTATLTLYDNASPTPNTVEWPITVGASSFYGNFLPISQNYTDPNFDFENVTKIRISGMENDITKIYHFDHLCFSSNPTTSVTITQDANGYADEIIFKDNTNNIYLSKTLGDSGEWYDKEVMYNDLVNNYLHTMLRNDTLYDRYTLDDGSPTKYLSGQTLSPGYYFSTVEWNYSTFEIVGGSSWEHLNELTDIFVWDGCGDSGTEPYWDTTDYGLGIEGLITTNLFQLGSYSYTQLDLSQIFTTKDVGNIVSLLLGNISAVVPSFDVGTTSNINIKTRHSLNNPPYIEMIVYDPPPESTIFAVTPLSTDIRIPKFTWENLKDKDVQRLYFQSQLTSEFSYNTTYEITTNKGTPITDFDGKNDKSLCYMLETDVATLFPENETRYVAMYIEDFANIEQSATSTYATKTNEVQIIRPDVNDFRICTTDGTELITTGIYVQDEVVAVLFGYGGNLTSFTNPGDAVNTNFLPFSGITNVNIDWGDGTYSERIPIEYDYLDAPASTTTIDVHDPTKFNVGDKIVIYDKTTPTYKVRTVTATSATNITVNSTLSATFDVADTVIYVANDLVHKYNYYGTFTAKCQLINDQGFGSDWTSVTQNPVPQNPVPQPINPIPKIKVSPKIGYTNELVDYVYTFDGSDYINHTNVASSEYSTDTFTPELNAANKYFYLGSDHISNNYVVDIVVPRDGTAPTLRYYNGSWTALTANDDTNALANTGNERYLVFDIPDDMIKFEDRSTTTKLPKAYYIRFEGTGATVSPTLRKVRKYTTFKSSLSDSYSRISDYGLNRYAFNKDWDNIYNTNTAAITAKGVTDISIPVGAFTNFAANDYVVLTNQPTPINTDIRQIQTMVSSPPNYYIRCYQNTSVGGKTGNTYANGSPVYLFDDYSTVNDGYVGGNPYWYFSYPDLGTTGTYNLIGFVGNHDPTQGAGETIGSLQVNESVTMTTIPILKLDTYSVNNSEADITDFQVVSFTTNTKTISGDSLLKYYLSAKGVTVRNITLTATATTDSDGDGVPDDIQTLLNAQDNSYRVQLTIASGLGRIVLHGYITSVSPQMSHQSGQQVPYTVTLTLLGV